MVCGLDHSGSQPFIYEIFFLTFIKHSSTCIIIYSHLTSCPLLIIPFNLTSVINTHNQKSGHQKAGNSGYRDNNGNSICWRDKHLCM